jgi:hypothetical protein
MKIEITEKQLHLILSTQKVIDEEETASTSQSGGGGGYPEGVGKWDSGVVRGSANQITNTKWSDTVGSKLIRGKANMLK